jgi:hypothetical protein|tara:strand:+ start:3330 stop:3482 length:153 start_codon:yes stop_codon:yes gene_type:complete
MVDHASLTNPLDIAKAPWGATVEAAAAAATAASKLRLFTPSPERDATEFT